MSVSSSDSAPDLERSEKRWEENRQKITRLYEQKHLAEVMEIMSKEESFVARYESRPYCEQGHRTGIQSSQTSNS